MEGSVRKVKREMSRVRGGAIAALLLLLSPTAANAASAPKTFPPVSRWVGRERWERCRSVQQVVPKDPNIPGAASKKPNSVGEIRLPPENQRGVWSDLRCWEIPGMYDWTAGYERWERCRSVQQVVLKDLNIPGAASKRPNSIGEIRLPPDIQSGVWLDLKCYEILGIYDWVPAGRR